ncbi:MAG: twin-arginine translocase subunit TatC [Candidatus Levybacteria bacterium]|nr:twin-arginine translocase subunit TatC [Candidatus Levybacteria bacterium]
MDALEGLNLESASVRYMPFLIEIRKRLLFLSAVFLVTCALGFIYYQKIILFILNLYDLQSINVTFTSPFQFVNLAISSGMIVGFALTLPLILHQVLSFLRPALHKGEYNLLIRFLPLSLILFVIGFSFGSWITKLIIEVYSRQTTQLEIQNLWDINSFLSQILYTSLLLGIVFQFPLVITLLVRFGVISHKVMSKQRKIAYAIILIVVILLPPTDLLSMVLIFLPLAIVYELTLSLNKRAKVQTWHSLKTQVSHSKGGEK